MSRNFDLQTWRHSNRLMHQEVAKQRNRGGHVATVQVGKGKVVPALNKAPRHEDVLGAEVQLHDPATLSSRERDPSTHCTGCWVCTRAILDAIVKRKVPSPH